MTQLSSENLTSAINKAQNMSLTDKELACDDIFREQPNLLASVLVQQQMGNTLEEVDMLLNILIVLHLAVKEAGVRIEEISELQQEDQLAKLTISVAFSEGMDSHLVNSSIKQYISNHKEPIMLSYVTNTMKEAGFFENMRECTKYLVLAGVNLANCVSNATEQA
jgi:hypothetical protein